MGGIEVKLEDCRRRGVLIIMIIKEKKKIDGFAAVYLGDLKGVDDTAI